MCHTDPHPATISPVGRFLMPVFAVASCAIVGAVLCDHLIAALAGYEIVPRSYGDFTVTNAPTAPALAVVPPGPIAGGINQTFSFTLYGTDVNPQDVLTFAAPVAPGGSFTSTGDREAVYEWTPGAPDEDTDAALAAFFEPEDEEANGGWRNRFGLN